MPWLAKMSHGFAAGSHNALSDTRMAVEAALGGCMLSVRANVLLLVRPGAVPRYQSGSPRPREASHAPDSKDPVGKEIRRPAAPPARRRRRGPSNVRVRFFIIGKLRAESLFL